MVRGGGWGLEALVIGGFPKKVTFLLKSEDHLKLLESLVLHHLARILKFDAHKT